MRSVFLEGIPSENVARSALDAEFPEHAGSTKVVFDPVDHRPVGYLYVGKPDDCEEQHGPYLIQADISGRQWDFDAKKIVVAALLRVQTRIGGVSRDYGD